MDYLAKFRERLAELMEEAKITTDELGKAIGVVGSAVRNWQNEINTVSLFNAISIADYFKCSLDFLFGRSEKLIDFIPNQPLIFYERLREIMEKKSKTRYRFCIDLKMSNGNFTQWKRGVTPKMQTFIAIADYLDVTLDYLIGRER